MSAVSVAIDDLWPGDVIRTENGWRPVLEIQSASEFALLVVREPEGSWLPSIGSTPTSFLVCRWSDEVEVRR